MLVGLSWEDFLFFFFKDRRDLYMFNVDSIQQKEKVEDIGEEIKENSSS